MCVAPGQGLNCSETAWDGGDCKVEAADDSEVLPGMQGHCGHDRVVSCDGKTCIPSQLLGDRFCDECTAAMAADGTAQQHPTTILARSLPILLLCKCANVRMEVSVA